ncbi:hypothetical protein [Cellulophaga sp. BC115SP]|uniref:hypothetical protein n=1 Tax=Cellulophaga sp. BC115SP TaxID=2683263 RepID=UPI0014124234|nr:hypothetical protein [Cellulophaga sp. BC115SP]NBB28856.1 hypothetical protein [Cellulophaga sp. BC115SP]
MQNIVNRSIYFQCSSCTNKGEIDEVVFKGGINDEGGFILYCNQCNTTFFIEAQNPIHNIGVGSRIIGNNFTVKDITDFSWSNNYPTAREIITTTGQDSNPIFKNAWQVNPIFSINHNDKIFICSECKNNIEKEVFNDLENNLDLINNDYEGCFQAYMRDWYNPNIISFNSSTNCSECKREIEYTAYSKFSTLEKRYSKEDFFIVDTQKFEPNINGVYTREQCKRILEKFILRWNLLASNIIIVSPFIGFDKKLSIKNPDKFNELLKWFLSLDTFKKFQITIRKSEYGKIREVFSKETFKLYEGYNLLNENIEKVNSSTTKFHAKFYAGIIPDGTNSYVEVLTGSYNLHPSSESKENLTFTQMSFQDFKRNYLDPMKIPMSEPCYSVSTEILKIPINESEVVIKPKDVKDIVNYNF